MMYSILLCALLGLAQAAPSPSAHEIPGLPGFKLVLAEWDVQAFPDGPTITLNGTVQEVHAQLLEINPNYETDFPAVEAEESHESKLVARTDFSNCVSDCTPKVYKPARLDKFDEGVRYLRKVGGQPRSGPGPLGCARVSCSWGSAIFWCNRSRQSKTLNSFGSIADGAVALRWQCANRSDMDGGLDGHIGGQIWHTTDWSVIAMYEKC